MWKSTVDAPNALPSVTAVGSQIQQVFINLILNAADAMPEAAGPAYHRPSVERRMVEILFQDSGGGVPKEKQANIFEPFFSTKDGGTGLGLTVSYNIITAHGGVLELLPERLPAPASAYFYLQEENNEVEHSRR
jgi:signal transduction histidine kinase